MAGAYAVALFGLGLLSPLWETVVADEVPESALGRVRSFDQLISFASRPFGLAVARAAGRGGRDRRAGGRGRRAGRRRQPHRHRLGARTRPAEVSRAGKRG
ncbi:hypothetical protein [Nonomuraea salmonea]|uniref:hypothetical protein n=1 Tax=Nonomuraea salmonea TaxID=46181 RepID=UPI002FEA4333